MAHRAAGAATTIRPAAAGRHRRADPLGFPNATDDSARHRRHDLRRAHACDPHRELILAVARSSPSRCCSLAIGSKAIPLSTVIDSLLHPSDTQDSVIVTDLRVPRTILGLLVGAALGLAGALMQALTRNPLADPGLLGVNAGASAGVVAAIAVLGIDGRDRLRVVRLRRARRSPRSPSTCSGPPGARAPRPSAWRSRAPRSPPRSPRYAYARRAHRSGDAPALQPVGGRRARQAATPPRSGASRRSCSPGSCSRSPSRDR